MSAEIMFAKTNIMNIIKTTLINNTAVNVNMDKLNKSLKTNWMHYVLKL